MANKKNKRYKRQFQHGLDEDQRYLIMQAVVMPMAIKKEQEAKDKGEELPVPAAQMVQNMMAAVLAKFLTYTPDQRKVFLRGAKKRYKELLNEID